MRTVRFEMTRVIDHTAQVVIGTEVLLSDEDEPEQAGREAWRFVTDFYRGVAIEAEETS